MGYEKLEDFSRQLLNSNAIKNLPTHEKEESVQAFINQNEEKLKATFSSPDYYPNTPWQSIKAELLKIVGDQVTAQVLPQLEELIYNNLNLKFKEKYTDFMIPDQKFREQLYALSSKLASRYKSRIHYGKMLWFMQNSVLQPFFMAVFSNRRYVGNGLMRYDDITYDSPEEALGFIYTAMLLLPLYDITLPIKVVMPQYSGPSNKSVGFRETENNGVLRENFRGKIKEIIQKEFPGVAPYFLKIMAKVFYMPEEKDDVPYISKVLKIVYYFALEWKQTKRERGAESFEASWLNVARINYKFYSYDLGTLDEFYKITIEEDL